MRLIPCGWFINKNSETATHSLYTSYKIHGKRKGGYVHLNSTKLRENLSNTVDYGAHIWTLVIKLYFKDMNQSITKLEMKHVNRGTGQCCIHRFGKSIRYHP